ncbi:MMPL family transporter [uncultured Campylobacter sp.]|uniref:efflux RND transporter permease subunit n=1 Tax=uncultured Campylobacter sp. TaxID=218934 RepID=UPI002620BDF7|nr:MMPL family transporter [uncultured Campylobacter sp.]
MKKIFRLIVAFPKITLALFTALALFFGYYSTKLEIDASSQTLLLDNDKDLQIWREVSKRYETPNFLVLAYTPAGDLLAPETIRKIAQMDAAFSKLDFVASVTDITNVPLLLNKGGGMSELLKHIPTLTDADVNLTAARREFATSPFYASNLVSADFHTTAILINLKPQSCYEELLRLRDGAKSALEQAEHEGNRSGAQISELKSALKVAEQNFKSYRDELREKDHRDIMALRALIAGFEKEFTGDRLFLGGLNMIADDMVGYVRSDLATYGLGALVLLLACFWLFFRQAKFILLPLIICAYSVVLAAGLFGFLSFEVTVISSNFIALQLIITVSVCIHLIVAYREFSARFHAFSQRQLVYAVLRERAMPCFFAIFTTVIGFMSLIFCDIKPVISLGIMMSVGISISLVTAFGVFGAVMSLLPRTHNNRSFEQHFKFTIWCAETALRSRGAVYGVCAAAVIFGLYGIFQLRVENSFIGYFKKSTDIRAGMEVIDTNLGGTIPLDIVVKFKSAGSADLASESENSASGSANSKNGENSNPAGRNFAANSTQQNSIAQNSTAAVQNSIAGNSIPQSSVAAAQNLNDQNFTEQSSVTTSQPSGAVNLDQTHAANLEQNSTASDDFGDFEAEYAANENKPQYWFTSEKMRIISKIDDFLKDKNVTGHEFIGNVSSLASLLKLGKQINQGRDLDDLSLALIYSEMPANYREMVLSPFVNIEANEAHFSVRTIDSDPRLRRAKFLKDLQSGLNSLLEGEQASAQISGIMVLYNNMLQSLMSSQIDTLGITVLVLFVLFVIIFRSLSYALIAIVVNLIPLCACFGIMGVAGIPLDIMSITIAAISIGIGVDDVIHYIYRYKREFARLGDEATAIRASHASIGYAMYYTSFAIILGFSVMMMSNFWPTIYFGMLICLVMSLLLLGALIILPSLIMSRKGLKFSLFKAK